MTTFFWAAVLGAALLHALWNSVVKSAGDKFMSSARVALWTGVVAGFVGLAMPAPFAASLPYVIVSALCRTPSNRATAVYGLSID